MFSQYFGQYLLNKGLLKPDQLAEAIEMQQSVRLKLGVLAINAGYMTAEQVEEIHRMQAMVDKKFGELAAEKGFVTQEKVEQLLASQKKTHLLLGQALIDKNYLSLQQLQTALNEYKKDYSLSDEQFSALQQDDIDVLVRTHFKFQNSSKSEVYIKYISLLVRNIIRFIDDNPRVEAKLAEKLTSAPWLVSQKIKGQINLFTGIAGDEKILLHMAGKYANENIREFDELAKDSIGEFLNLHNGVFLVNMSNQGVELEMTPQKITAQQILNLNNSECLVTFYLSAGQFDLIISESSLA